MNDSRKSEIKVGITVVIGVILTLWILGWAKNVEFFSDKPTIKILFDSVAGLEVGDRVTVNGVKKGLVENIEVIEGDVMVTATMDADTDIREDAVFSIMMLDLMGGKKVEVSPGHSEQKLDYKKIHRGRFSGDISTAMAALSDVQGDLVSVVKEIKTSLNHINKFMGDENFTANVKSSVSELNDLIVLLNKVTSENRDNLSNLLVNIDTLVTNTNTFLAENKTTVKDLSSQITASLNNANELLNKLSAFADETKESKNNLGKILYDKELITELRSTVAKTNKLFDLLIEQMENDGINVDANIF